MSLEPTSAENMRALLLAAMDGDATPQQLEQLNGMLRTSDELRDSAVRFLADDSYLSDVIKDLDGSHTLLEGLRTYGLGMVANEQLASRQNSSSAPPPGLASSMSPRLAATPNQSSGNPFRSVLRLVDHHGLYVAALAATLLVAFGWHYLTMRSELEQLHTLAVRPDPVEQKAQRNGQSPTETAAGSNPARVTGLVNCKWAEGETELKFGDWLAPGDRLKLKEGLIQLTFGTGAKVVVEGPSDFLVSAPGQATLEQGKIAAIVPRSGRGYTILTPTAEVVDLGTEFGVEVDDAGTSEVHVFDGDVVARPRGGVESEAKLMHAQEDEAIQFRTLTEEGQRIAADVHKFVRRLTPGRSTEDLPPLPVTKDLVLWLTADTIPDMRVDAPVATWPDILIGDNRYPDDAMQFDERRCPIWLRDERGLPAVKFDGWSKGLATSPMATGDQVTAFVVFAASPISFASERHGGMLLKFGLDTPSLEYSLMPDQRIMARVWSSHEVDNYDLYLGQIQSDPVKTQTLCAATYCHDAINKHAELFVNGRNAGVSKSPGRLEQHAKKYLGHHPETDWEAYFHGNIYEVIVFNTALAKSERDLVHQYLSKRFDIPLVEEK
jgi:hypothetical protein